MHCRTALLLISLCGPVVAQPPADIPNLSVPFTVLLQGSPVSAPVVNAMEREVESLLAHSHIRMNWVRNTDPPRVYELLAVVTLRGACRPNAPVPAAIQFPVGDLEPLGQTQVVDGRVLPFADVRCDSVRKLIARGLYAKPSSEREDILGRALGRVMAHELYHILLRSRSHGTIGLARPVQTSADLIADRDNFAPADERKLAQSGAVDEVESSGSLTDNRSESQR
jgi:hypothetical protein